MPLTISFSGLGSGVVATIFGVLGFAIYVYGLPDQHELALDLRTKVFRVAVRRSRRVQAPESRAIGFRVWGLAAIIFF